MEHGRHDLPADVKVKLYNQVLQRYNTYDEQRKATPIIMQMVDSLQPAKEVPTREAPVADHIEQETLESVPPRMQKKAKLIINRIKNSSDLQWTPKGELVYKGQVVENTNVSDLVNDMLRKRKHFEPTGWQTFAQALKDTNVPQDLIGHQERWNWMQRQSQVSQDRRSRRGQRSPSLQRRPSWVAY